MRAIWSGSVTFGLIAIPVKLYTAVASNRPSFRLIHEDDGEPVHYKRECDAGHEVDWGDIVKGYEYAKGSYVTFSHEELDALGPDSIKAIDVESFVALEEIDPIYYDRTYFIVPDNGGEKAYHLFAEALEVEGVVGIGKVAIREKEHLAALRLRDGMLVLETMHWPDEVRAAEFEELGKVPEIRDKELKTARSLVQQLTEPFEPERFEDDYRNALEELVAKKVEGEEITTPEPKEEPEKVTDLMEALRASVEDARGRKRRPTGRKAQPRKVPGDQELEEMTKDELYAKAQELDVRGRSDMDKSELIRALRAA